MCRNFKTSLRGGNSLEVDRKNIGIGAVFQYFGSASTLIGGVIFYTYVVKYYSQSIYASIGVMQAILSIVTTIFIFGLSQAVQHFISHHLARSETDKIRSLLKKTFLLLVILMSGSFLTIFLLSPILAPGLLVHAGISLASANESLVFLSVASAAMVGSTIVNSMVLGFQRFKTNGFLVLLNAIVTYGSASFLLYRFGDSQAVAAGWAASYTFMLILGLFFLAAITRSTKTEKKDNMDLRPMLRYSIPILLASIVSTGSVYADRLIVDYLVGGNVFAVYSYALLIASSVAFLVSPLNNILLPKFSEYFSYNDANSIRRGIRLTINVATFIYTPIAIWIAVLGMPIILVLGHVDYTSGAIPLAIILVSSALFISQGVLVQGLQGIRVTSIFIISSGLSLLSNIALSVILIPRYPLVGAAIGYSSVIVINFLVILYFALKFKIASYDFKTIGKVWVSSVVMLIAISVFNFVILPLSPFSSFLSYVPSIIVDIFYLFIYIVIGLSVYVLAIRITRAMRREDIEFFYTFVPASLQFSKNLMILLFVSGSASRITAVGGK